MPCRLLGMRGENFMKKISIIIPCFNAANSILPCLTSVENQTMSLSNFEIILVDDASTDETLTILEEFEKKYPDSVCVVQCSENGKAGTARNIGMQYASGEYFMFVDSDDIISADMLSRMYSVAQIDCFDIVECNLGYSVDEFITYNNDAVDIQLLNSDDSRRRFFINHAWTSGPNRRLYRSDFLINNHIQFIPNLMIGEDLPFSYLCNALASKVAILPDVLYCYVQNSNSLMHSNSVKNYYMDVFLALTTSITQLASLNLFSLFASELRYIYFKKVYLDLFFYMKNSNCFSNENFNIIQNFYSECFINTDTNNSYFNYQDLLQENFLQKYNRETIDFFIGVAERGGVENTVNQVSKFLTQNGVRVRVIQAVYEGTPWVDSCIEFHYLLNNRNDVDSEKIALEYANLIRQTEIPDLVIATAWPLMTYIAKDVMDSKLHFPCPIISWLHTTVDHYCQAGFGGIDALQGADAHFAISNDIKKELSVYKNISKIYTVHNPIDENKIVFHSNRNYRKLTFVGRLSIEKNVSLILKSIASASGDWFLDIIGEGPEESNLKREASKLGIENKIKFWGWQSNPFECARDNGFLILSSYYEGSPLAAIEGLACGMGVISTPVSGIKEIIEPGKNGYIFEMGNPSSLTSLLNNISAHKQPIPLPEICKSSINEYEYQNACKAFYDDCKQVIFSKIQDVCSLTT